MYMTFENLNLIEPILKALRQEGYTSPTPIQEQSIPILLQGKDLLGCARKFASQGSDLILNARNVAKLEELKVELEAKYGVRICLLPFDVRDRNAATMALASLPEEWKRIDVLVNNAGLVIGVDKEFEGNLDE